MQNPSTECLMQIISSEENDYGICCGLFILSSIFIVFVL